MDCYGRDVRFAMGALVIAGVVGGAAGAAALVFLVQRWMR